MKFEGGIHPSRALKTWKNISICSFAVSLAAITALISCGKNPASVEDSGECDGVPDCITVTSGQFNISRMHGPVLESIMEVFG